MKKVNRPYSATDVFNNLHGTYSKSQVVKALDKLVKYEQLISKVYGKSTIYSIKQHRTEEDEGDNNEIRSDVNRLTEKLNEIKNENKKFEEELANLKNEPTTKEAINLFEKYKEDNEKLKERLDKLTNGSILIPPEKRKRVDEEFEFNRNMWKKRRKLFRTIFNTVTEHLPGNPNEFKERLGIEEDKIPFEKDPLDI
ncbi:hypothetical protein G6F64_002239 [Rhizopus arrhizus]|uniref:Homologous-pairing protein 2 homolog n=1 Tax=Rhizopus oryzae TaxID=64495 RepID=A0A9P7BWC2_RHIOR|nr:hypothetical protein G6F64_002239 [Rhizopus arrhizus]